MPLGTESKYASHTLMGVLALIALNGFFAATEFSLVAVRLSRVRQLVREKETSARGWFEAL